MESFYSLQGEGYHSGKPAYFIRLAGCDVGCHWCDVKESWEADQYPVIEVDTLVNQAVASKCSLAVVTGGEPLMHNLEALCRRLQEKGLKTHLETSGCYQLTGQWDWICFSPKKFKKPLEEIYAEADELKVVIYHSSDFQWAEEHADKVGKQCRLFLQPEWSKASKMNPLIIDYVKKHPQWQVSLQIHKFLEIP